MGSPDHRFSGPRLFFIASEIVTGYTGAQMPCQWSGRKTQAVRQKGCSARARLKARANRAKSASVSFSRRLSRRTTIKKAERKGRRSFDTARGYGTVGIIATEKTRTAKSAVRATCSRSQVQGVSS